MGGAPELHRYYGDANSGGWDSRRWRSDPAGARNALINMIELLQERGWTREQAYIICSVAVNLKVSNIVDLPNVTVSAFLPEDIFQG
jgi:acetamidase/formamidase